VVPPAWQAFPVVDPAKSGLAALLVGFNDIFFMALMFFLSGLFLQQSITRKGVKNFLRDRALRLGVPFLAAAALLAPLAYYPSYLQAGASGGLRGFWRQWHALGNWPAGPAWFIWVLLVFDALAAGLFLLAPHWAEKLSAALSGALRRPILFFLSLALVSAVAYVPLEFVFTAYRWSAWGPFAFQTSRVLHYLAYFLLGIGAGAYGLDCGLIAADGRLARRWWMWSILAVIAFVLAGGIGIAAMTSHVGSRGWEFAADLTWVLSCAASSLAFLALFTCFAKTRNRVFDSLSANAYGIYLIHYAFVSWLQLSLVKSQMPGIAKASLVTLASLLLSWATTAGLRRIPAVNRLI